MALLVTLIPMMALWTCVVGPLADLYGERAERLAVRRGLAERMSRLAAERPALQGRAGAVAGAQGPQVVLLDGGSDALAAATLQNRVQEMATSAGVRLSSVEIMEAVNAGDYRRIGLKVSMSGSWSVLVGLLTAIEQSPLPMMVDGLLIRANANNAGGPGSAGQSPPARPLDASFTVSAFRSVVADKTP